MREYQVERGIRSRRVAIGVVAVLVGMITLQMAYAESDAPATTSKAAATERVLRKEVTVKASIDDVWHAWTTSDGIESFFAPKAIVELRVGGSYELHMKADAPQGKRGTEGCHVLSYLPKEMLSFEWNFPPTVPNLRDAGAHTHIVLMFDRLDNDQVRVRLAQLGWQEGEDWDKGYAYFDRAWTHVMQVFKEHFEPPSTSDGKSR